MGSPAHITPGPIDYQYNIAWAAVAAQLNHGLNSVPTIKMPATRTPIANRNPPLIRKGYFITFGAVQVNVFQHRQVVVQADDRVQHTDNRQPDLARHPLLPQRRTPWR